MALAPNILVHAALLPYIRALRDAARRLGASFRIVSGYRSQAEQRELQRRYEQGDQSVVFPPAKHSYHELGLAVDVESDQLIALGQVAKKLGMRWGGDFGDPVHFDLGRR